MFSGQSCSGTRLPFLCISSWSSFWYSNSNLIFYFNFYNFSYYKNYSEPTTIWWAVYRHQDYSLSTIRITANLLRDDEQFIYYKTTRHLVQYKCSLSTINSDFNLSWIISSISSHTRTYILLVHLLSGYGLGCPMPSPLCAHPSSSSSESTYF